MRIAAPLLALITLACAGGCGPRGTWTDLDHDGLERGYVLYSPSDWTEGTSLPVVFVLHGGGGKAAGMQRFTGFNTVAEREGFHVVYPEGVNKAWNDGREGVPDRDTTIDDIGFLNAVVDDVDARLAPDRRFITGVSNGAFMTWAMVCSGTTRFDGMAPVIGGAPADTAAGCEIAAPIPGMIVQGTDDPLVPYEGGMVELFGGTRGEALSTADALAVLRQANGCDPGAEPTVATLDEVDDDDTTVVTSRWTEGCTAPVEEVRIEGGGHTWPGGGQYAPKGLIGVVTSEIQGEEVIWEFFDGVR